MNMAEESIQNGNTTHLYDIMTSLKICITDKKLLKTKDTCVSVFGNL